MAYNNYYEGRGEGYDGMVAISWVVKSRVQSAKWADYASGVIFQPSRRPVSAPKSCQFSWTCAGVIPYITDIDSFRVAFAAALNVLEGLEPDPTRGSMHYVKCSILPNVTWARTLELQARIGRHCFLK